MKEHIEFSLGCEQQLKTLASDGHTALVLAMG
jgi:hypothetical protein